MVGSAGGVGGWFGRWFGGGTDAGRPANLGTQHFISTHFGRTAAHLRHRRDVPARDRWVIVAVVEADTPVLRGLARPDDGGRKPVLVWSLLVLGGVEAKIRNQLLFGERLLRSIVLAFLCTSPGEKNTNFSP